MALMHIRCHVTHKAHCPCASTTLNATCGTSSELLIFTPSCCALAHTQSRDAQSPLPVRIYHTECNAWELVYPSGDSPTPRGAHSVSVFFFFLCGGTLSGRDFCEGIGQGVQSHVSIWCLICAVLLLDCEGCMRCLLCAHIGASGINSAVLL